MAEDTDTILIEAAINGDETAFAELIRRYQNAVWGTVHRTLGRGFDCEDIVQEIFLRVLVSLKRFNGKYPFGPWILRIASNYCIDQLRRKRTRKYRLWSKGKPWLKWLQRRRPAPWIRRIFPDSWKLHGFCWII
jgi:DNA-directed RNA polymerase specialized sigma24 family protein